MVGRNAPGDGGLDVGGVNADDVVEMCIGIRSERQPTGGGRAEVAHIDVRTAIQIGDRLGVRVDVAAAGSAFDGHVAIRHALFHGHAVEDISRILIGITDPAFST